MRGFITLASTRPAYLEMAVDLALSLREVAREPIALILGDELRAGADPKYLAVFDRVVRLPPGFPRNIGKLFAPQASPFDRTLFIDADCLALDGFDEVWDALAPAAFALQGAELTAEQDEMHGLRSTADTMRRFQLGRYVKSNSGIFYFRKAAGIAVAEACLALHRQAFTPAMHCDETLLAIVSDRMPITVIPQPLPMAWLSGQVDVGDRRFKLIHFIGRPKPETFAWQMAAVQRRRAAAGLPPRASLASWRWKTRQPAWRMMRYRAHAYAITRYIALRRTWRAGRGAAARSG